MNSIPFTKEKFAEIKKEYEELLIKRKEAVVHLSKARAMGDLSENGYYRSSKSNLIAIDFSLRKLSEFIKHGYVIEFINKGFVSFGCRVTIENNNEMQTYLMVGMYESDPKIGKISNESPLGKNLMGKREGENFNLETPSGKTNYKIIKIE